MRNHLCFSFPICLYYFWKSEENTDLSRIYLTVMDSNCKLLLSSHNKQSCPQLYLLTIKPILFRNRTWIFEALILIPQDIPRDCAVILKFWSLKIQNQNSNAFFERNWPHCVHVILIVAGIATQMNCNPFGPTWNSQDCCVPMKFLSQTPILDLNQESRSWLFN